MKRFSFLWLALALSLGPGARAQDAATEERLNKLSGRIDDLIAWHESMKKQLNDMAREIETVREQASKPTGNYANKEDLKSLAEAVREIDRKRLEDNEKIHTDLLRLRKSLETPLPPPSTKKNSPPPPDNPVTRSDTPEKGFEYVIQKNDTLSVIVQRVREEKKIKITTEQLLKANPNLKEKNLQVGKKIFIPSPS